MGRFILGNIGYFIIMGFMIACCVLVEGQLAGKILCLGLVSLALGTPVAKRTRLGLIDKRYKEMPFVWWQILIGLILLAIGGFMVNANS